jgi:condensin-2 complex subunit H2
MDDEDGLSQATQQSRFRHLLKPCKDLAKNFDIDLAGELSEYLEFLEKAEAAFGEDASCPVNFAEAAALVQVSTDVYAKKVEHLVILVDQTVQLVKGLGRPGKGAAAKQARSRHDAPDSEALEDTLHAFWNSDTLLKEGDNIDMDDDESLLLEAAVGVRAPALLLALDDTAAAPVPASAAAAASAGANNGAGGGDGAVYRLQQCFVHVSGALLLDPRDADLYDAQLR